MLRELHDQSTASQGGTPHRYLNKYMYQSENSED